MTIEAFRGEISRRHTVFAGSLARRPQVLPIPRKGKSNATINRELELLRRALRLGHDQGQLPVEIKVPMRDLAELMERQYQARLFTRITGTPCVSEYVFHRTGPIEDFRGLWERATLLPRGQFRIVAAPRQRVGEDGVRLGNLLERAGTLRAGDVRVKSPHEIAIPRA